MKELWRDWLKARSSVLILVLLLLYWVALTVYLVRAGMKAENVDWAKEQISAILGALLYALASRNGGNKNAQ